LRNAISQPIEAELLQETLDLGGGPQNPELIRCVAGLPKEKKFTIIFDGLSPYCGLASKLTPGLADSAISLDPTCLTGYDGDSARPNADDVFLHELRHVYQAKQYQLGGYLEELGPGSVGLEPANPLELSDLSLKRLKECESKTAN